MKTSLTLIALALLTGCASHFANNAPRLGGATNDFAVAPKALLEAAKQAVAPLPIETEAKGVLVTGWQEFPGEWHVARRWQERTRFRISVTPDFDDPTGHSRIEVTEETQQRATNGQNWETNDVPARPERSEELLKKINQHLGGKA